MLDLGVQRAPGNSGEEPEGPGGGLWDTVHACLWAVVGSLVWLNGAYSGDPVERTLQGMEKQVTFPDTGA